MIKYNNRYRGPFEYDKFKLNIFQLYNQMSVFAKQELNDKSSNVNALINTHKKIDDIYTNLIGNENKKGLTEKVYELSFKIERSF